MKAVWAVLATVVMSFGLLTAAPVRAQSGADLDSLNQSLTKCVGYAACKQIQDKIDAIKTGAGGNHGGANYAILATKCPQILTCSTEDLEVVIRESDALRQEACGAPTCSDGNLKLMTQTEKEYLAKGNRARFELASRNAPKQSTTPPIAPQQPVALTPQQREWCNSVSSTDDQWIAGCSAMIAAGENLAGSYTARSHAYGDTDHLDESLADATQAIAINPNYAQAYSERGATYMRKGMLDQALADLNRSIALQSKAWDYYDRGLIYGARGLENLAIADFRTALRIDPNYKEATAELAKRGIGPELAKPATSAVPNLNGEWLGESSGNRVALEVQSGGLYFTAVTRNLGQATTGYLFRQTAPGVYKYRFPDGTDAVLQILGASKFRSTNPDGWTDVFDRVGASSGQATSNAASSGGGNEPGQACKPTEASVAAWVARGSQGPIC